MGNYVQRNQVIIEALTTSGLLEALTALYVVVVGDTTSNHLPPLPHKAHVILTGQSPQHFEQPTIQRLYDYALSHPSSFLLYIHSKGVSRDLKSQSVNDWIELLLYFNIHLWRSVPRLLADHNIACPNWNVGGAYHHCSGNYWWARADYVASLKSPGAYVYRYYDNEYWIGSRAKSVCVLWPNSLNHYCHDFPKEEYNYIKEAFCMKEYPHCLKTMAGCEQTKLYARDEECFWLERGWIVVIVVVVAMVIGVCAGIGVGVGMGVCYYRLEAVVGMKD